MTYDFYRCKRCGAPERTLSVPVADLPNAACDCGEPLRQDWAHKLAHFHENLSISVFFHVNASAAIPKEVIGASAASEERRAFVKETWAPEPRTAGRTTFRYGSRGGDMTRANGLRVGG